VERESGVAIPEVRAENKFKERQSEVEHIRGTWRICLPEERDAYIVLAKGRKSARFDACSDYTSILKVTMKIILL